LADPDSGVTAHKPWLMGLVIIASSAALLGTTDESPGPTYNTYTFARTGVDGGFVELTRDAPRATFFVTITANDLGPAGVESTDGATAVVDGTVTTRDLADTASVPFLDFKISSPDSAELTERQIIDHFLHHQDLVFTGNCVKPTEGAACRARFQLELWRTDDGAGDGVVRFDWLFDLASQGRVEVGYDPKKTTGVSFGPLDPPWTVDVSQQ
jgi:hypothetical protein